MTETLAATALYAYAVVETAGRSVASALGDELTLVGTDELAVVVERVPLTEFGEEALARNLNDREWLEEHALRHEDVVRDLLPVTTVVPLRFGSIHLDQEAVQSFLALRHDELRSSLERVRGCVEVGVKAWLVDRPASDGAAPATGREYLEQRKRARDAAAAASEELGERLLAIHERLLAVSEDGVLNRPQSRELTEREETMVLNSAYLVRAGDDRLAVEVGRAQAENAGLRLELTGPWAPYNFVGAFDERR